MAIESLVSVPTELHRGFECTVEEDWIDYNGHMNVAYYVLAFDRATDHFAETLGLGPDYLTREQCSFFVVDMNVTYRREVGLGTELSFATHLVDFKDKKMLFFHYMFAKTEGFLAATNALLAVHVNMRERRSEPFPTPVLGRLAETLKRHAAMPVPHAVSRGLSL